MTPSQRILVNTAAQYTRTIINVCLSLYSTRLILAALGQTDFGIYNVVAGVVAMLSFMTNALVVTTQRYLCFHHGKGDHERVYQIYANSSLLHAMIAIGLLVILGSITYPVTHHFLHIEPERIDAASWVYLSTVVVLCLTFITAPFRALFLARENIVYISVVDVLDGIIKLLIAIFLTYVSSYDKLILYAVLLVGISVFNLAAFAGYALKHFQECHIPKWEEWNIEHIKHLSGFAGWTIYSTGCIIVRTQGIAVLLNRIFGSLMNAAYGIALQVSGAIHFLAQALMSAINPQIFKAEGAKDREHMLRLAEAASKYAYLLLSMVAIPLTAEMPAILVFWLGEVPEHAVMFCQFVLVASCIDQLTIGLGTANQAIGDIRNYSLTINTIKVLSLPAAWVCLRCGLPVESVMWCYLGFEAICALARMPFLKHTAGLEIGVFIKNVFGRCLFPTIAMAAVCYIIIHYADMPFRFLITLIACGLTGVITTWFTALQAKEKEILTNIVRSKILNKK